jgi:hypothetical protein
MNIEVNFPTNWNGRRYMFGNGGFAGESFETASRAANRARSLKASFATAATDMFHCGASIGTSTFDTGTPLVRWVEEGEAPASIPAAQIVNRQTVRMRPLCQKPEVAGCKGSGSIDDTADFTCLAPNRRPAPRN